MATGVMLAMTAVSGAVSAYSQYQQGKAQQANHEYNAQLAENQAEQGQMEARENAKRGWKNNEEQLASVRARMANEGAVGNQGAPLAVMGDIAGELELNVQDAYRGAQIQRTNLYQSAKISRREGKSANKAGKLMALGTLIKTGSSFDSNYTKGISSGVIKKGTNRTQALMGAFGYKNKQYYNR